VTISRIRPLAPRHLYVRKIARYGFYAVSLVLASLAIGVLGYRGLENLPWIDALLNAAMIMGGMGPVDTLHTVPGKLFASLYALYCGVLLLVAVGILLAPVFERFLHRFHLELGRID
jgi:hypothetical protein